MCGLLSGQYFVLMCLQLLHSLHRGRFEFLILQFHPDFFIFFRFLSLFFLLKVIIYRLFFENKKPKIILKEKENLQKILQYLKQRRFTESQDLQITLMGFLILNRAAPFYLPSIIIWQLTQESLKQHYCSQQKIISLVTVY